MLTCREVHRLPSRLSVRDRKMAHRTNVRFQHFNLENGHSILSFELGKDISRSREATVLRFETVKVWALNLRELTARCVRRRLRMIRDSALWRVVEAAQEIHRQLCREEPASQEPAAGDMVTPSAKCLESMSPSRKGGTAISSFMLRSSGSNFLGSCRAVILIPMPLPKKIYKPHAVPICSETDLLQTVLAMGMATNVTAQLPVFGGSHPLKKGFPFTRNFPL